MIATLLHFLDSASARINLELLSQCFVHYSFLLIKLISINNKYSYQPKCKGNDFKHSPCDSKRTIVETCVLFVHDLVNGIATQGKT
jgi:hypothetical protein